MPALTNVEAFTSLTQMAEVEGGPFFTRAVVAALLDRPVGGGAPDEVVARGLTRAADYDFLYGGSRTPAHLSVIGLVAAEEVEDPFGFHGPDRWLLQAELTTEPAGRRHTSTTLVRVREGDPEGLDGNDPAVLQGIHTRTTRAQTIGGRTVQMVPGHPGFSRHASRVRMIRAAAEGLDGAALISPLSTGLIGNQALRRTVNWLLEGAVPTA